MKLSHWTRWVVLAFFVLALSSGGFAQIRITVSFGPPPIPVYEQPLCPGDGYLWVPGYWDWDEDFGDYYWVPGTWVLAPHVGYYWTPPWWGWEGGVYLFHAGYWGPHVGFYGGINYGYGYFGDGYWGGRWDRGRFLYNRDVSNINVTNIHNVYNEHVTIRNNSRVSYNGGQGGIEARATHEQTKWMRQNHLQPVQAQRDHQFAARGNQDLRASFNRGKPSVAATGRPGDFQDQIVRAKEVGGAYTGEHRTGFITPRRHQKELPPLQRGSQPSTGNPNLDTKYQRQREKLYTQQEQQRQALQRKQENEHMKMQRQNMPPEFQQRVEQKHQQQTDKLVQKQTQKSEHLAAKQTRTKPQR